MRENGKSIFTFRFLPPISQFITVYNAETLIYQRFCVSLQTVIKRYKAGGGATANRLPLPPTSQYITFYSGLQRSKRARGVRKVWASSGLSEGFPRAFAGLKMGVVNRCKPWYIKTRKE